MVTVCLLVADVALFYIWAISGMNGSSGTIAPKVENDTFCERICLKVDGETYRIPARGKEFAEHGWYVKEEKPKTDELIEPGSVVAPDLVRRGEGKDLVTVRIDAYNDGAADVAWEDCEVIYIMGGGEGFEVEGVPAAGSVRECAKAFRDCLGVGSITNPLCISFESDDSIAMVVAYENVQGDCIERLSLEVNEYSVLYKY